MKLKKGDFVIAFAIVISAILIWFLGFGKMAEGSRVEVFEEGKLVYTASLSGNSEMSVSGCTITVSRGEVRVSSSDCPDKVCEKSGSISRAGEIIVCAPNRVSVKVSGKSPIDAYVS